MIKSAFRRLPRSVCLQLFDTLLRNVHRLRVCTLDSLFAQLARSFPFELGLPPAWRLTDEIEDVWFRERAVDSVIAMLEPAEMTAVLSMLGKGETKRSIARELLQVVDTAYSSQRQCGEEVWHKLVAPKLPDAADITRAAGMMRLANPRQKRHQDKLNSLAESLEVRRVRFARRRHVGRQYRRGASHAQRCEILSRPVPRRTRRTV